MDPELLTTGEFTRAMDRLHARFDATDDRVDDCVAQIAALNERTGTDKKQTRNSASGWSAAVASGIVIAVEALKLAVGAR